MRRLATYGVLTLFVAGCMALSDDPAQGGFLGGVAGLAGGSYQQRLDRLEAELSEVRRQIADGQRSNTALRERQAALQKDIARLRREAGDG